MREYELTYLVSDEVSEADLKKVTDKVAGFITAGGGKISKEESWGRRKLAYPINKQNFATYITVWFESDAAKLAEMDHELRVYPQVIRHLTTLKVEKSEELKVSKEDVVGAEEVEKVIGERSFEVVQGETEASKDLMAVREKDDEESEEAEIEKAAEDAEDKAEDQNETAKEEESEEKVEEIKTEEKPKKTRKAKAQVKEEIDLPADAEAQLTQAGEPVSEPEVEKKVKKTRKSAIEKLPEEQRIKDESGTENEDDEADRIKKLDEKLDELLKDDL